jgi:TDG/mug DNA glycosylase family protein
MNGNPRRRPSPADLAAARGTTIPDVAVPGLRVLFAGINPGLYSAATGYHFARPGNRFWPALHLSGFTDRLIQPHEQECLLARGLGITNVVARATARAGELTPAEIREGGRALASKAAELRPQWLAIVGITVYRTAFGRPKAREGAQDVAIAGSRVWVLPNPSGLNAAWTTPRLVDAFRELKIAVDRYSRPGLLPPCRRMTATDDQRSR